jgi:hypothetical protein
MALQPSSATLLHTDPLDPRKAQLPPTPLRDHSLCCAVLSLLRQVIREEVTDIQLIQVGDLVQVGRGVPWCSAW